MMNISKWLPQEDTTIQEYVFNCKKLNRLVETLICKLGNLPEDAATWKVRNELSLLLDLTIYVVQSKGYLFCTSSCHRCS